MMDIKLVVFIRGKRPEEKIIQMAKEKGIAIMTTNDPMFIACGKLYSAGITERGVWD